MQIQALERRQLLAAELESQLAFSDPSGTDSVQTVVTLPESERVFWKDGEVEIRRGQWIVQFDRQTLSDLEQHGGNETDAIAGALDWVQRRPAKRLLSAGESIERRLYEFDDVLVRSAMLNAFSNHPGVLSVEPNFRVSIDVVPDDPSFPELWGLDNPDDADIDAPEAWELTTGNRDIVVGVIDTGVDYNHEDLAANIWVNPAECPAGRGTCVENGIDEDGNGYVDDFYGWDFINNDNDPMDDNSHGTHVAGTIAAVGDNATGVVGVNWNSQIMALKFLGAGGGGYLDDAVEAIEYATMMKRDHGVNIRLTNNSWGGGGFSQTMYDAIAENRNAGMLFVAAAGNDSKNNDSSPAYPASYNLSNIISVASTTSSDGLSSFSNYGLNTVDLGAPGSSIYSTIPNNRYGTKSGTSMASPHVAGVAALAWGSDPAASYQEVRTAVMGGVDRIPALTGRTVTGGRLNALTTLQRMGLFATVVSPQPNTIVDTAPTSFTIDFSDPINVGSVSPADLKVNGIAATGFNVVDSDTIEFTYAVSPVTVEGVQTIEMDENSVTQAVGGDGVSALFARFFFDPTPLRVSSVTPVDGGIMSLPNPSLQLDFTETLSPGSIGINDLVLSDGRVERFEVIDENSVVYYFTELTNESVLTVDLIGGTVADSDGFPNEPFSASFPLDIGTIDYPGIWETSAPLGSRVRQTTIPGLWHDGSDEDRYVINLESGQRISFALDPSAVDGGNVPAPRLRVLDPGGTPIADVAAASDAAVILNSLVTPAAGDYTVLVSSADATAGAYDLRMGLSTVLELESTTGSDNGSLAAAETIDNGWTPLPASLAQVAVAGEFSAAGDDDWYSLTLQSGVPTTLVAAAPGLTQTGNGPFTLSLHDGSGATLATGVTLDDNARIDDWIPSVSAEYFVKVSGADTRYVLSTTGGGTLDRDWIDLDRNGTPAETQPLELPPRVVGHVGGDFQTGPGVDATGPQSSLISLDASPEGDMVRDVVYTPDGSRYLIAHRDSENVLVYDSASGNLLAEIPVQGQPVDVDVTPDGNYALSANTVGNTVTVINLQTLTKVDDIETSSAWPYRVHSTADSQRAIVATAGDEYVVISLTTMTQIDQFEASGLGSVSSSSGFAFGSRTLFEYTDFVITPDGGKLIGPGAGVAGSTVDIFDLTTGDLLASFPVQDRSPSIVMTADGNTVYAVSRRSVFDSTISKIDLTTNSLVEEIAGPGLTTNQILLSPDEQELIGGRYNSLYFIDVDDGSTTTVFAGDTDGFAISHDGNYLLARDLIDLNTKTKVASLPWFNEMDMVVASPTELRAFQVGRRATDRYKLIDINGGSASVLETRTGGLTPEGDMPVVMQVTADALTAVTANYGSRNLSVVDLSGQAVTKWIDVGLAVDSLAITPDGTYAVASSASTSNSIVLVDLVAGTVDATLTGIDFLPRDVAISADGTKAFAVTTGFNEPSDSLYFIDVDGASSVVTGSIVIGDAWGGSEEYSRLQLSPDGSLLAIPVTGDGDLVLVDTTTNLEVARVSTGQEQPIEAIFSPDGTYVYVRHRNGDGVSAIRVDGVASNLQKFITGIPYPIAMTIDDAGDYLYVATSRFRQNNEIHVVDARSFDVVQTVSLESDARPTRMHQDGNVIYLLASLEFTPQVFALQANDQLMRIFAAGSDSELVDKTQVSGRTRLVHYSPALQSAITASADHDHVELIDFSSTTFGDEDYYQFLPQVGDTLTITSAIPGAAAGLIENDLDIAIEVFDPQGNRIGYSDSGTLQVSVTSIGTHTIHVFAQNFTHGEYVLSIDGATITPGPSLVGFSPVDGAEDVAPDATLTMQFDEVVLAGSGQITIKRVADDSTFATIDATSSEVVIDNSLVTITPAIAWELGTEYYVLIAPGAFTGVGGEPFAGISDASLWDFAVGFGFDFGDAPSPYPVTQTDSGARHSLFGPHLGSARDSEPDGMPSAGATGDDSANVDDEDGVVFGSLQVGQIGASFEATLQNVTNEAFIDAWIDFNADGHFGGNGEHVAVSIPVAEGSNTITFDIPSAIASGETYARVRVSTAGGLGVTGNAPDGEVEDYLVAINPPNTATTNFYPQERLSPNFSGGATVVPTDLDGDGDLDLVYPKGSDNNVSWMENVGRGEFVERQLYGQWNTKSVSAVDFDGDGDQDVVYLLPISDQIGWFQNQGNETFIKYIIDDQLATPEDFSVVDFDQDGDQDIVLVDSVDDVLLLYENNGDQTFNKQILATNVDAKLVKVADLDRDGDLDIVVNDDGLSWYEQTPTGWTQHAISNGIHYAIEIVDVDSDGDLDVVSADSFKVHWYENDGSAAFTQRLILNITAVRAVEFGDLDGDGDMDAIAKATNSFQNLSWLENDGNQNFLQRTLSDQANQPADIRTGDMDSDGDLDIVFSLSSNGVHWIENINGIPLTVESLSPGAGGAMAATTQDLSIRFDQPIQIGSGEITIHRADDDSIVEVIDVQSFRATVDVETLVIDPLNEFETDTEYYATVDYGAVMNLPGDPFEGFDDEYWTFRTVGSGTDYGDAPDQSAGTAPGDYNTTAADNGPSHVIDASLYLGRLADNDDGTLQDAWARGDDSDGILDDENALVAPHLDLVLTEGAAPTMSIVVTNLTESDATLTGWIDYDGDGNFEAGESAQLNIQPSTDRAVVALTFPIVPAGTAGETFARIRLGADAGATSPVGASGAGEVEDHLVTIRRSGLGTPASATELSNGIGGAPALDAGDRFGASVASVGDLNGDGVDDLAIAAPDDDDLGPDAGAVYIALMNSDGSINSYQKLTPNFTGLPFDGGDRFGAAIAPAGDLDHDGVSDLYVMSLFTGTEGPSISRVMLNADGTVKDHTYNVLDLDKSFPQLTSFTPIGDLNADGTTDFAFGEITARTGSTTTGAVYIMLTADDGSARQWATIASDVGGGPTLISFEQFGASLTSLGDLDGDGVVDLAVGAHGNRSATINSGAVYVLMMKRNGTVKSYYEINGTNANAPTLGGLAEFGYSAEAIGDLNADGVTELLVGARGQTVGTSAQAGQAYVLYLAADGSVTTYTELAGASGGVLDPPLASFFGTSVAPAGDINGDGHVDLAVGSLLGSDSSRGTIHTILLEAPTPPDVESLEINNGETGRSVITSLEIAFDQIVDHQQLDQAFTLTNTTTNTPVGQLVVSADDSSGKTIVSLGFAGDSTVTRPSGNSLDDGNYRLVIHADKIQTSGGTEMVSDHVFGDDSTDEFFRWFGDSDGDRDVDGQDYGRFGLTFLKTDVDAAFDHRFDSDGDGDVDGQDYGRFGQRFLKQLPAPGASS